jgi:hypothetical protein
VHTCCTRHERPSKPLIHLCTNALVFCCSFTVALEQRDETKRSLAPKLIGLQWRSVEEVLRVYRASGFVNDLQRDELIRFGLVDPDATK